VIRLWVLSAARRPRRALTTVLVLAVLTVATTSSLVAGDALARLFREDALAEWGQTDVEARSASGPFLADGVGRRLAAVAGPAVHGGAPRLELRAVATAGGDREPDALVLGLGAEEVDFASLRARSGAAGVATLRPDQAVVNARLAERLRLEVGSTVQLLVAVPEWREPVPGDDTDRVHPAIALPLRLEVAGVVADAGVADLHRTPNVLVRREVLQEYAGLSPAQSTALHLDVRENGRDAAEDVIRSLTPEAQRLGVALAPVKEDALDLADEEGGLFRSILLSLAVLVLLAATAASVELLTALNVERLRELAVLRAVGLSESLAAKLLSAEALLYAAVGVALGVLLALPTSAALARALADHFAALEQGRGREQVPLTTDVGLLPVVVGAVVVAMAAVLAARASGRRVLAADLDAQLRGEAQAVATPSGSGRTVAALVCGAWLLGAGTTASSGGGGALTYLGLTLLLAAGWLRARRRSIELPRTDTRWALGALVWSLAGAALLGDFASGVQAGFGVLTVAGVLSVTAAASLVAPRLRRLVRAVRRGVRSGDVHVPLLVGAAWTSVERDRAVSRTATVGGTLFIAAALTVLGSAQALPVERQSGGFDALGTAVVDLDVPALRNVPEVEALVAVPHTDVAETAYAVEDEDGARNSVPYPVRLVAGTAELAQVQSFGLADTLPEYATAQLALEAVNRDEDKAVVDRYALPEGAAVGDDVVLEVRGAQRRFTLVAVLDTYLLDAVVVGPRSFDDLAARSGDTFVLAAGRPGLVPALGAAAAASGLDLRTVEQVREQVIRVNRTFTDVFAVMLLLSLVVVVVSIGAATVRTGRQRRSELGVLQAVGVRRAGLLTALVVEPVLAAAIGAAVGLAVGLVVLRLLFALGYSALAFVLDPARLAGAVGLTLLLVVVTSVIAARAVVPREPGPALADLG
jgi:putative ABC transport system permease protein